MNNFLMSYQSTPHTTSSLMRAQRFIGRYIGRLFVKKKSHDENEIRLFSSKDNVIV